jgi:septal ring factor EnvC (AmiA/AmiB activator)
MADPASTGIDARSIIQVLWYAGTVLVAVASATWWLSQRFSSFTKSQTSLKEDLTAQIVAHTTASAKNAADADTKLGKLQGSLELHTATLEQKLNNLQEQMSDVSGQLKETRNDTNELRERVVRLETMMKMGSGH